MSHSSSMPHGLDLSSGQFQLLKLNKVNVILGKNGCGKSSALRSIDGAFQGNSIRGMAKYITPERGGSLRYDGNVETNVNANPNWLPNMRRVNRSDSFRQVSVGEFRRLEMLILRKIERDPDLRRDSGFTFDTTVDQINSLLDQVQIERGDDAGFRVKTRGQDSYQDDLDNLSSGESELISLAIEALSFIHQANARNDAAHPNVLLLDEPDVHLHPDLQERLMDLLHTAVSDSPAIVVIATHSTAILSALAKFDDVSVGFMRPKEQVITFRPISDITRAVLPIFGAHPLSNVFNKRPILLVEGEDDERIWQWAVRSSGNRISVWPCAAGDIQSLKAYEAEVEAISAAVYDRPVAYSLRDQDGAPYDIGSGLVVRRMRLKCRAAENLLLTDDVLEGLRTDWPAMRAAIEKWIADNPEHRYARDMQGFREGGYDRRDANVKSLRNLFMERAGSEKPWEVAVGQTIAKLASGAGGHGEHSLRDYLGPKLVGALALS